MSRPGRRFLHLVSVGAILAVSLATVPASAQGDQEPYFYLTLRAGPAQTIDRDLGRTTVTFNVTVSAQQQAPINTNFLIQVRVVRQPQSLPNGWVVSEPEPISKQVRVGETFQVSTTVELQISDPVGDRIRVGFDVTSTPVYQGAPSQFSDALAGTFTKEDRESVSQEVLRDLTTAQAIVSFARQYMVGLVVGSVALLGLFVVTLRRRKGSIVVATDAPQQEVMPGRGVSFPISVRNEGPAKQVVTLGTSEVPPGWSAIVPLDRVELGPRESQTIWLTLKAPEDARPGQHVQASFVANAPDGTPSETLVEASVVEVFGSPNRPVAEEPTPPSPPRRRR